jgi:glyoxylase-like metal-dependent hydrolase (beta-lactamase superfamily II)
LADPARRHPANAPGPWFVDETCINCDVSRQCAPWMFAETDGQAVVARQPETPAERADATRALLACPSGSIGVDGEPPPSGEWFPQELEDGVFLAGFNSPKAYGANAFFVSRPEGNLLVDSPRFTAALVRSLEARGGVAHVLLTHRDHVADAASWAERFSSRVWIHEDDADKAPWATDLLRGQGPSELRPGLRAVPLPGHTRGSVAYLLEDRFLFTGDSLYWSRARQTLEAFRSQCRYSWEEHTRSLERLAEYRFEWVLPGHGTRHRADPRTLRSHLEALVARMPGLPEAEGFVW